MPTTIYLIRHAEAVHNVTKDFSHLDPPLTALGLEQASALAASFPVSAEDVAVVLTSPLTRALETTLAAFGHLITPTAGGETKLLIDPNLQERSDLPCDTGSDRGTLEERFPAVKTQLEEAKDLLGDGWYEKRGLYAPADEQVATRAKLVREKLRSIADGLKKGEQGAGGGKSVVVVTHGVFMKFLAEDDEIDLPKAGWKAFTVQQGEDGGAKLVPI